MNNSSKKPAEFGLNEPLALKAVSLPLRGEMVTLAREERGQTQEQLALLLGVKQGTLCKLENGILAPSDDLRIKLAEVLDRPAEFFAYAGPIEAPTFVQYRRKTNIVPAVMKSFWARITLATLEVRKLLVSAELVTQKLPCIDPDECAEGVIEVARRIRRMWKLPPGPIRNLMRLVENSGCLVVRLDFGTRKIDGCSGFVDELPVIFINTGLSAARQRLTIAHELGHLIMHRYPSEEAEDEAFLFASELLAPGNELEPTLRPLSMDKLARLKLYWGISMQALIKRAESLGAIQPSTMRYYWAKITQSGYRESEPYDEEQVSEKPSLLNEIIDTYIKEMHYSEEELARLLMMNTPALMSKYRGFANHLRIVR